MISKTANKKGRFSTFANYLNGIIKIEVVLNLQISVIGSGETASPEALQLAEEVGKELGRQNVTVITGGLFGVMEAVCRGVKQTGGTTIGILPGTDPSQANKYVDVKICTGIGYARNLAVVKSGMAVIAISGAFGTLSEIGHALGDGIPVIGLRTWSLSRNGNLDKSIITANSAKDAVGKDRLPNGNYIQKTAQHFVIISDGKSAETALISMSSTQAKVSRKWNSMMMSITKDGKDGPYTPPPFSHIYKLSSVKNTGKGNEWYGYNIQKVGEITDTSIYNRAKKFYESCRRADQSDGKVS